MRAKYALQMLEVAAITLTLAAVLQEMEKPKDERTWHGNVGGVVPYDFRKPTLERLKDAYWNPESPQIFTPEVFGVGWAVNFHALLDRLRDRFYEPLFEEDFLMPTQSLRETMAGIEDLEQSPPV